ncbi:SGNH/GDSL hydrolase family protein [Phycisphaerales bacterium AB-hyl4]|uniref:SGNH/GDSL hydrolase family protein n=1 Tax=Natronomicrosphaera hydrolytica TaxID=3242702 RepID=A0ABV4U6M3_9BACT
MLQPNDVVLFQGDSITDAGRDRGIAEPNHAAAMGRGYALLTASALLVDYAEHELRIFNRGVSGNRVTDLADRWQADCLDLKPTVLSILIGVNDTWHGTGKGEPSKSVPLDKYETVYRDLLEQARKAQPKLRLVLCEPFTLRCGAVTDAWFPEIDQRRAVVQQLARDYDGRFVAFQSAYDAALSEAEPAYWAADGVHPSLAGHQLMARTWLKAIADF